MRSFFSGIVMIVLLCGCGGNEKPTKAPYGFVSAKIKDGRKRVSNNRYFGFTDSSGKEVIALKYHAARDFCEGLAMVTTYNGEGSLKTIACGFIDTSGKEVIKLKYRHALDFSEGIAAVMNDDRKWGYINKRGDTVLPFAYNNATSFEIGKAYVEKDGKRGIIDRLGTITILGNATPDTTAQTGW